VRLALVEVQVQRALGIEQAVDLAQPRLQEAEVVVEAVAVRRALEELGPVAAAAVIRIVKRVCARPVLKGGSA
jgi:peptide subunit release factor 1 (eRF1)